MTDIYAIKVSGVSKSFRLPHEKQTSVKGALINLGKGGRGFEKQQVLNNISFEVKKGEFFGIVGRNGSGKSTLLKLLAGIYTPDKGAIQINGKLTPFIELGVGFNPELSGRDNVFLNGALLGFSREEMAAMYSEIVEFAELERFMDQKLKNYSSGMQVRLAFSIAIRAETEILVLDEVLAVGDTNFQNKCFDFFSHIRHDKTIIFVSHDMSAVKRFCDRTLLLEKGHILEVGKAEEIALRYGAMMARDELKATKKNSEKGVHIGTGGVSITGVRVLNSSGESVSKILPREKFSIQVDFSGSRPDGLGFLSTIFNSQGQKLFSATTYTDNIKTSAMEKRGSFRVSIKDNVFAPGTYKVNVGIFNQTMSTPYDHFRDAMEFVIAGERKAESNLTIEHEWL